MLKNIIEQPKQDSLWLPILRIPSLNQIRSLNLSIILFYKNKKHPKADSENDGWFPCTIKDLETFGPYMDAAQQTRMLNYFEKEGYIRRKKYGKPVVRYLWINEEKIQREIEENI